MVTLFKEEVKKIGLKSDVVTLWLETFCFLLVLVEIVLFETHTKLWHQKEL